MRRIALTAALCLWAGGAFADALPDGTINIPSDSKVYIDGRDLQKQLDAIQTQLKCLWIWDKGFLSLPNICDAAFKDIEPK